MGLCTKCGRDLGGAADAGACPACDGATLLATDETLSASPQTASTASSGPGVAGRRLGPIRLIRRLGRGGMGEVWLGHHDFLGRDVAVKLLLNSVIHEKDPAFTTFMTGARAAAAIEHPGLNKIYHADVVDGTPYLVLELLDGPDLGGCIARNGPLDLSSSRAVIESVCEAIAELNQQEMVHRDIKPSNIVLTIDGRVVVTDFGLACARPASGTKSGGPAGTPAYMAPEMFDGVISVRTDVYALGMTAFHLLSGKVAFSGDLGEQERQHRSQDLDIAPLVSAHVPTPIIDVITRATCKDAMFRPKTAWHLLQAFGAAFDSAKINRATAEQLAAMIRQGPEQPAALQPAIKTPSSSNSQEMVSSLATLKREQRKTTPAVSKRDVVPPAWKPPEAAATNQPATAASPSRRRIWMATVASSFLAAAVGAFLAYWVIFRFKAQLNLWIETHLNLRDSHGRVLFPLAELVEFAVIVVPFITTLCWAYRRFRGPHTPAKTGRTTCGWCEHELRFLSQPMCPECGHRIGDNKRDSLGRVPSAKTFQRRAAVVAVLILAGAATAIVIAVGIDVILRALDFNGKTYAPLLFFFCFFYASIVDLLIYEFCANRDLRVSGRSWCRRCQHELKDLAEPVCPNCQEKI